MPASITDLLRKGAPAFSTTLSSQKTAGAATCSLSSATGLATDTAIDITVGRVDSSGTATPSLKAVYTGTLSGTTVSNLTLVEGTDQTHASGTPVEITFTAAQWNDLIDHLLLHTDQDGTLKAGAVDGAGVLASNVVTNAKVLDGTLELNAKAAPWDGWTTGSGTWTYASATTFTVPAADAAAMAVGTKIKLTQTTAKYFYVTGISGTTITVTGGSDYTVANAAITSPNFSNVATPASFPQYFNWTPTLSNITKGSGTESARFIMISKEFVFRYSLIFAANSAMGSNPTISFPITTASTYTADVSRVGETNILDSGTLLMFGQARWKTTTTFEPCVTNASTTYASLSLLSSTSPMTWTTNDQLTVFGRAEAA